METKTHRILARSLIFSFILMLLLAGPGLAQTPVSLTDLNIAIWPEYDQPEVLVIYRATVADDVTLPAPVTFNLPPTVETLHAVAFFDQEQGSLVNADYELLPGDDGNVLSLTTPSRQIQFEYYSGDLLSTNGENRQLTFIFIPSSDIANFTLELQQPTTAQAFTSDPSPATTEVRQDGLVYALYNEGAIAAGDSFSLQASYSRSTDELSIETFEGVSIPSSPEQTPVEIGGRGVRDYLGLILIVAGVLLLIGAFAYWFWSQRAVVVPEPEKRRSPARRRSPSGKRQRTGTSRSPLPSRADNKSAAYCHRCGTKLRDGAEFCHACGAERRGD